MLYLAEFYHTWNVETPIYFYKSIQVIKSTIMSNFFSKTKNPVTNAISHCSTSWSRSTRPSSVQSLSSRTCRPVARTPSCNASIAIVTRVPCCLQSPCCASCSRSSARQATWPTYETWTNLLIAYRSSFWWDFFLETDLCFGEFLGPLKIIMLYGRWSHWTAELGI